MISGVKERDRESKYDLIISKRICCGISINSLVSIKWWSLVYLRERERSDLIFTIVMVTSLTCFLHTTFFGVGACCCNWYTGGRRNKREGINNYAITTPGNIERKERGDLQ